ncbi:MAG: cytochrome C biogenesis protein [Actinobacteria bacterium]|nr:cytochrome C biogenesis protein [Actinomycetota bacterium]
MRRKVWLDAAAGALLVATLAAALAVPPERTMGDLARLMFVHVPAAWLAYLAFGVTLVGSAGYLATRRMKWDRLAAGSAEVGVCFNGLTIALGMIWGKSTWGVWWTWDARLVLTAIMFFVYLGYLGLRRGIADPVARARRSAWLGVLGAVQIPIVHFSVVWWRGLHQPPSVIRPGGVQMDDEFRIALAVAVLAFTAVYAALLRRHMENARAEEALAARLASEEVEVAGAAITAPRYGEVD